MKTLKEKISDILFDFEGVDHLPKQHHDNRVNAIMEVIEDHTDEVQLPIVNKDTFKKRMLENPNAKSE